MNSTRKVTKLFRRRDGSTYWRSVPEDVVRNSSGAVAVLTKGQPFQQESKEAEATGCSKLYDPCTKEKLPDFFALEKRVNEIRIQLSKGQFDINSSSSLLTFMEKVFLKPDIYLPQMILSLYDPMAYISGKEIFHMICLLFCFFGGIPALDATYSGQYVFKRGSELLEPKEAFAAIRCGEPLEEFLSSISFQKVRERVVQTTDPYCTVGCDTPDSESIQEYAVFVVPKISDIHYDNRFVESIKKRVEGNSRIKPIVFFDSDKASFEQNYVGEYEEVRKLVGDAIYSFDSDLYPFLQGIRANIFRFAKTQSIPIVESFVEQYLTKGMLPRLQLQLHQDIIVNGVMNKIEEKGDNKYAIGVLARGGKTFIAGGIMREYLQRTGTPHLNIFWITAAPNETRLQVQSELLGAFQDFQDYEFIEAKTVLQLQRTKSHAVFFCSSQLLLEATRKKSEQPGRRNYLTDLLSGKDEIGLVFFDEAHKTAKGYETYTQLMNLFTVYPTVPFLFLTATYYSILPVFDIKNENTFLWTYTDVLNMRMLDSAVGNDMAVQALKDQFGDDLVSSVLSRRLENGDTNESLSKSYKEFPDIYFLSADFNVDFITSMGILDMYDEKKGFRFSTIFELAKGTFDLQTVLAQDKRVREDAASLFMNKKAIRELLNIFTPTDDVYEGFEATPLPKDQKLLMRIDTISRERKSRLNLEKNPSLLMFLPSGGAGTSIFFTVCAWASLLMTHPWWRDHYEVACIVEKGDIPKPTAPSANTPASGLPTVHFFEKNLKENLLQLERTLQCTKNKGLIVLAGEKLSMGISLPCVDVVCLFNDKKAADDTIQKLYRALTPSTGKTTAFIVDLNPARSLSALYTYAHLSMGDEATPYDILNTLYKSYAWDTDVYKLYKDRPDLLDLTLQGRLRSLYTGATVNATRRANVAKQYQKLKSAFGSRIATTVRQKRVKRKTETNEENANNNANTNANTNEA